MPARVPGFLALALLVSILASSAAAGPFAGRVGLPGASPPTPAVHASHAMHPWGPMGPSGDASVLLGWINHTTGGTGIGNFSAIENRFVMSDAPMPSNGQQWDIGDGIPHSEPGVTNFTRGSDPDIPGIVTRLTDGVNEWIELDDFYYPTGGGGGYGSSESYLFGKTPDFVGFEVDLIRLNITNLAISYSGGYTTFSEAYSWEIWGHPLFVYFVPPTDPDGTYLLDRATTDVNVGLAGSGNASLEWDGTNRSMMPSGSNRSATVSGVANGVHAYRVWATNATGTVFVTPLRHLTVGIGIWHIEHAGVGYWPSIARNATGVLAMCYYTGSGLVYAERGSAGWTNSTIAGGGALCSLAFDANGAPHISYLAGPSYDGNYDVSVADRSGSGWTVSVIQHGFYTPTSIAINPVTDEPMVSYSQVTGEGLKLATRSGGAWTTQVVDPTFYGQANSLAVDDSGRPMIAYPDYTAGILRVARWTGSTWTTSRLDANVTDASIRFDANGTAHVAYASRTGLQYATWNGTGWSIERVDEGRYYGVSLAFDSFGRAHIAYAMGWGGDVREAVHDGAWKISVITHANGNGKASLAPLPSGHAAAAFSLNDTNGDLVIASDEIDTLAPRTHVVVSGAAGSAGWYRSAVRVSLVAEDDWSGVASVAYRLDGGPWTPYNGSFVISFDGGHTLEYRATDFAGNVESAETMPFGIDATPPTVAVLIPTGTVTTSDVVIRCSGEDTLSGIAGYTLSVDGGPPAAESLRTTTTVTLALGTHTVRLDCTDLAGNVATSEIHFVVDTNPMSLTGPYHGAPAFAIVLAPPAVAAVMIWLERRKGKKGLPERPEAK